MAQGSHSWQQREERFVTTGLSCGSIHSTTCTEWSELGEPCVCVCFRQWGVVERQSMYTAAVHGLRNVVLDAAWFAVTAVPTEARRGRERSLTTAACAGGREACMQLGADAAALPRVKRVAVEEMHNGKAAAATCVSTSRQVKTTRGFRWPLISPWCFSSPCQESA